MNEYNFIGRRGVFGLVSVVLVIASLVLIFTKGINRSVDFAGGTQLSVMFAESGIKEDGIRDLVNQIDKKATVYMNKVDSGSSFTIKIKNPEVEEGKEAEASMERLHKLEKVFASIQQDEQKLLKQIAELPAETIQGSLLLENPLGLVGTDEEVSSRYAEIANAILAQAAGSESIADLAAKADPEQATRLENGIRLAFPAINRVTKDFLGATLKKFNPLNRGLDADYNDISEQVVSYRETNDDFISNLDEMSAGLQVLEGENVEDLKAFFNSHFTLGSYNITSNETFSPSIAAELLTKAWEAILLAMIGILIYISMRFTMGYAVASIVALLHDVIIALGAFSLIQAELSNPVVAAFLTIVGYSLNDTIVVFDRIRENVLSKRKGELDKIMNTSINQTISRTLVTSLTTLFVVLVIYLGANATLRDFAFPLLIGIVVGTYSSIFVASPVLLFWSNKIRSINNE